MEITNHHNQILFIEVEKTKKEIISDIIELEKFNWNISIIYDNDGYASNNHNSQFLNIESLYTEFYDFHMVCLDNECLNNKRTVIRYIVK